MLILMFLYGIELTAVCRSLVVPVCTAAALQRYELALSSRARAVPSSSILDEFRAQRPEQS